MRYKADRRDQPYSSWCKDSAHDFCRGKRRNPERFQPRLACECPCGHEWQKRRAEMDMARRKVS